MQSQDQKTLVQQLFLTHHGALRGFVFSMLPDLPAAEDVVQETFLTATNKAADFQPGTNFFAWVSAIARFHVLRARRNNARLASESFSDGLVEALADSVPDDAFDSNRTLSLTRCLERLPKNLREVIRLRYVLGHGPGEISQLLTRTTNSVNVSLAKARAALRSCVQKDWNRQELA
jgi:RNA polymerase sigma-70 factor (ECF subfamily)